MHVIQRKQFSETYVTSRAFQEISDLKIFPECFRGPLKKLWPATCCPRACSWTTLLCYISKTHSAGFYLQKIITKSFSWFRERLTLVLQGREHPSNRVVDPRHFLIAIIFVVKSWWERHVKVRVRETVVALEVITIRGICL